MQRFKHTRGGTRLRRALAADAVDGVAVRAGDEPFLEREGPVRRIDPGAQPPVGRGKDRGLDAERRCELRRHRRKWHTLPQGLRAHRVQPEVE